MMTEFSAEPQNTERFVTDGEWALMPVDPACAFLVCMFVSQTVLVCVHVYFFAFVLILLLYAVACKQVWQPLEITEWQNAYI